MVHNKNDTMQSHCDKNCPAIISDSRSGSTTKSTVYTKVNQSQGTALANTAILEKFSQFIVDDSTGKHSRSRSGRRSADLSVVNLQLAQVEPEVFLDERVSIPIATAEASAHGSLETFDPYSLKSTQKVSKKKKKKQPKENQDDQSLLSAELTSILQAINPDLLSRYQGCKVGKPQQPKPRVTRHQRSSSGKGASSRNLA